MSGPGEQKTPGPFFFPDCPMPFKKTLFCLILLAALAGCSGTGREAVISSIRSGQGAGAIIEGVPFFPQDRYDCGPSALASVISFYGAAADLNEIRGRVYNERLRGTLPLDMLSYAKERGFEARYYKGGLDDLRQAIKKGEPLILFLNLGYDFYPVGHYIVAVGVSDKEGAVLAHSGTEQEKAYSFHELEAAWSKTGYSTLLIRPKGGTQ